MMEGRYRWDRKPDSSVLECGHLELWEIEFLENYIF
jgi:hypothetical protein